MPFKSKSNTPSSQSVEDSHPCNKLSVGSAEQISNLKKLQPTILANQLSNSYETESLVNLRTEYNYIYVVNWLYNYRGFLKLQSEPFDVDIFELELLHFFPGSLHLLNYDESNNPTEAPSTFINKLRLALISAVQSSKLSSLNNFEKIFRLWFGNDTPLGGTEDQEDDEYYEKPADDSNEIKFDQLSLSEKFEILYILIFQVTATSKFRDWVDKFNLSLSDLRVTPLHSELTTSNANTRTREEYVLLFDHCRCYKRTIQYIPLVIPKKRKFAPEDPNEFFKVEQFDVKPTVQFELVFKNIYEFDESLAAFAKKSSNPKFKGLYSKLSKSSVIESIFTNEIRKRKYITNKRKEMQLESLLATRKRSSRLEAKEHKRQEEYLEQKKQEEIEFRIASERRLERRRNLKNEQHSNGGNIYSNGLSRDDRLKQRKLDLEAVLIASEQKNEQQSVVPETESSTIDAKEHLVVEPQGESSAFANVQTINVQAANVIEGSEQKFESATENLKQKTENAITGLEQTTESASVVSDQKTETISESKVLENGEINSIKQHPDFVQGPAPILANNNHVA